MSKLVNVFGTRNPLEAQIVQSALEAAGVDCHIVGSHQAGHSGIFEIQLVVRDVDEPLARQLLAEFESGQADKGESAGELDVELEGEMEGESDVELDE
jgi:hypothetical protein